MTALVKHALCALYPRTDFFPGLADLDLDRFVRDFRRDASAMLLLGMYAGLVLFVLTPVLTVYVPLPSFLLPRALLDRHASRAATFPFYPLRSLILVLKLVAGLCWGAHPLVRERLGLPPLPADPQAWRSA